MAGPLGKTLLKVKLSVGYMYISHDQLKGANVREYGDHLRCAKLVCRDWKTKKHQCNRRSNGLLEQCQESLRDLFKSTTSKNQ